MENVDELKWMFVDWFFFGIMWKKLLFSGEILKVNVCLWFKHFLKIAQLFWWLVKIGQISFDSKVLNTRLSTYS